jgi:transposase
MLSQSQRAAILEMHAKKQSSRTIARLLNVSRWSVREVLRLNTTEVPALERAEICEPYRQQIIELLPRCKNNLVRVQEELASIGATLSYSALTAFCRRHGIGQEPIVASGRYPHLPGIELQHDTSPHKVELAGKLYKAQTASAVLCYSRMLFFQIYPTFTRFDCKVFLTEALRYIGASPKRVEIDNTHVVVLRGTGRAMVPVPEMAAFAERYGFQFAAHELGDANRSAHVERQFDYIENNFLAGRSFSSWPEMNQQAREWCDRVNATYKRHLRAAPRDLFAMEQQHLQPLPVWVPEVYRLHERMVDVEGYVNLNTNRYSVPVAWIGRRVEVRETCGKIEIQLDARHLVTHERVADAEYRHIMLAEHSRPRGVRRPDPHPKEALILKAVPEIADYVAELKKNSRKMTVLALRQLLRMVREYPREPLLAAITEAARYGLYDLDRVERMILRLVARDYFLLNNDPETEQ